MSKSTVQRRFREYGISVSSAMSQQTDDQLDDIVRQIKSDFPNAGYRRVDSQLRYQGIGNRSFRQRVSSPTTSSLILKSIRQRLIEAQLIQ